MPIYKKKKTFNLHVFSIQEWFHVSPLLPSDFDSYTLPPGGVSSVIFFFSNDRKWWGNDT